MKASAGSGKTYSLAREYIRLLLTPKDGRRDENAYRHILAVTFTNKATGEMKSRIIEELDILAHDTSSSDYLAYLMNHCGFTSVEELGTASEHVLSNLLNDYGAFSVSTIDKFFQQTLRAFAREIGQVAEYQIELDRDSLVAESAERVLDSLSEEDSALLKWLSNSSVEQIEDGRGYHLESVLGEFAKGYMSESYKEKAEAIRMDEEKAFSEQNLNKLRSICKKIVSEYEKDLGEALAAARTFFSGFDGVVAAVGNALTKLENLDHSGQIAFEAVKIISDGASEGSRCFNKKAQSVYGQADFEAASKVLCTIQELAGKRLRERNTALLLEGQVYVFRVAESLQKEFDNLLKEKNVLSINDTNSILNDIIGGTEIPFIYEKLGVRYNHFLLDEFQDTATVQWENFRPLLANSISEACYNLVVGDVKQSIYRWRNTDWAILESRVGEELDRVVENPLKVNWRSARNIVEFNNDFYAWLAARMDTQLDAGSGVIRRIYRDVEQEVSCAVGVPGCVDVTFCDPGLIEDRVVEAVLDARDNKGFSLSDIAVIVRTNSQGGEVAGALIAAGVEVVTNDSLLISAGATVRQLVAQLYRYNDPAEKVKSFYARDFDPSAVAGGGSLVTLAEELLRQTEFDPGDTPYVLAFLDLIRDFEQKNGNSLGAFLKYWEDEGMKKSISSPEGSDAVTIITIHRAKGLDYPCVILPMPRSGAFMKTDEKYWESPDLAGSKLAEAEPTLYHVGLSQKSENTLFRGNFIRERQLAYIDNANLWYVAMTRASQLMHIVAPKPSSKFAADVAGGGLPAFPSVSAALYQYLNHQCGGFEQVELDGTEVFDSEESIDILFRKGEALPKWTKPRKKHGRKPNVQNIELNYVSYPQCGNRGKLKVSSKAREFFFPEEIAEGEVYDCRRHGTLVHSILENVNVPSDLRAAIDQAAYSGLVGADEAMELEKWLEKAIAAVEARDWFSVAGAVHRNERSIYDPSTGEYTRPDRVVVKENGCVEIIDYKTGRPMPEHKTQVAGYVDSYRKMGYADVSGYLWYIGREVVEVK